jgi:hypothetical protein
MQDVEIGRVALLAVLVAVAGPVGVTLGWWLGRRGQRERQGGERATTDGDGGS